MCIFVTYSFTKGRFSHYGSKFRSSSFEFASADKRYKYEMFYKASNSQSNIEEMFFFCSLFSVITFNSSYLLLFRCENGVVKSTNSQGSLCDGGLHHVPA